MEQVFFRIHVRVAKTVGSFASANLRSVFEILSFINGALVCGLLFWLHVNYIPTHGENSSRNSCIETYVNNDLATTIENCEGPNCSGNVNMWKIHLSTQVYSDLAKSSIQLTDELNDYGCGAIVLEDLFREYLYSQMGLFYDDNGSRLFTSKLSTQEMSSSGLSATNTTNKYIVNVKCRGSDEEMTMAYKRKLLQSQLSSITNNFVPDSFLGADATLLQLFGQQYVFLFSRQKALLMMRPETRGRFGVTMKNIQIMQSDAQCMGDNAFLISLLQKYIGFDAFMRNWAMDAFNSDGYLYSVMSKDLSNLNNYQTIRTQKYPIVNFNVVVATIFLYFVTTSLTGFTLKSTQEKMLKFAYLLQHHVRNRIPYFQLVSTHIVESFMFVPILVGMQYFVVEFFQDHLLSFFAITAVWMHEVFAALCVRTNTTRMLFPKFFVAYALLFTLYCDNYPYGFPYVALVAVYFFVVHAMVFFYNHFEIPALESGEINAMVPRQWINVEVYENVQPNVAEGSSHEFEDTIWHTGGVRRRRDSGARVPVHNTTIVEGGVSTSTIVLGSSDGSESRVLLQAPAGINLSGGAGKSSSYVQNLALSRLIQYEQMDSLLGEAVMQSSHTSKTHYKSRYSDDTTRYRSGSVGAPGSVPLTWFQDIMFAFGVGKNTSILARADDANRGLTDSLSPLESDAAVAGTPALSNGTTATGSTDASPTGVNGSKKGKKNRPVTGISSYDMTGYKPDPSADGLNRRKPGVGPITDRPIPTRKSTADKKARAADPVDDFGHKKEEATYNAFGPLEEDE